MFVDSHCHLDFDDYQGRIPQVLEDMAQAQVQEALCISTQMETFPAVLALAEQHDALWATVGVHPDQDGSRDPLLEELIEAARHPKVLGIGETGLDYYRLGERTVADMQWQRDRFQVHLEASRLSGLPLVIHTRSSADDTLAQLRASGPLEGVFHCFTESIDVARQALDLGFYISFSGILSFKNAKTLHEVAAFVPLDRCLIETDSPYLAPVPHRGKTNTPAWVPCVAQALAQHQGCQVEDVGRATTDNFITLFHGAKARARAV